MRTINGTNSSDALAGDMKDQNVILGLDGDDTITAGMLADELRGGRGSDKIAGGSGDDTIYGDTGNDLLSGGQGNDLIAAGEGDDNVAGGKGNDTVTGGKGNDVISGDTGNDNLIGNSGDDTLIGGAGNDTVDGSSGNDKLVAGSGDDLLIARTGTDLYSGGAGYDSVDFHNILGKVIVDLTKETGTLMFGHVAVAAPMLSIEALIGNDAGDTFTGSKAANVFAGGAGNDWMRGGAGSDTMTGGGGADTFVVLKKDLAGGSVDTIKDFDAGTDQLNLSDFLKGHAHYADALRLIGTHGEAGNGIMVQGLVDHAWTDVALLDGLDINSIGVDHHAMILADLGLMA